MKAQQTSKAQSSQEATKTSKSEGASEPEVRQETLKLASLTAPMKSYPTMGKQPAIVSDRYAGDAPRLEDETDMKDCGAHVVDIGEPIPETFEDEDLDVKQRTQADKNQIKGTTTEWEWNPVRRFVSLDAAGTQISTTSSGQFLEKRPVSPLRIRQRQLRLNKIGIARSYF
eukprot:CAMPEP_0184316406 /NCGR_PEP_ID=MMETSP1049-20130417/89859_1 /TAXON_ID=77928 /ORGANISM="Proteomonas sulcata, Strain CCMP704" /LENGTH=170 /DNA_ID=CAMNT_0026635363 /DNA_START=36 /DNA_END=548 /DNA_ORIENTATION=+